MELKPGSTDILHIYRELVSSFSGIDGFSGWMIAKAEFKIEKAIGIINRNSADRIVQAENKLIKKRKNYSVISSCKIYKNLEYTIIMYIVKTDGTVSKNMGGTYMANIAPGDVYPGFVYLCTLKYTTEDIRKYTEYIGDNNPIHHTSEPVVPGFMMFEDIIGKELYKYVTGSSIKFVISFRKPVFAGEPAEVYKLHGRRKIIAVQPGGQKDIRENPYYKWEVDIL